MRLLLRTLGALGMVMYGGALAKEKYYLAIGLAAFFILTAAFEGYIEQENANKKSLYP